MRRSLTEVADRSSSRSSSPCSSKLSDPMLRKNQGWTITLLILEQAPVRSHLQTVAIELVMFAPSSGQLGSFWVGPLPKRK